MKIFNAMLCCALLLVTVEVNGITCEKCPSAFHCEQGGWMFTVQHWQKVSGGGELYKYPKTTEFVTYYCGTREKPYAYARHWAVLRVFFTVFNEPHISE